MQNIETAAEALLPIENETGDCIETPETVSSEIKDLETAQEVPIKVIPTLLNSEIKSFRYTDGVNNTSVRYAEKEGIVFVCGNSLMEAIFGKTKKYQQLAELKEVGCDYQNERGKPYYTILKANDRLLAYNIAKKTYHEKPEDFAPYVRFVANGGMNQIAQTLGIPANFGEPRDLFYLGIDMLQFLKEVPEIEDPKTIETAATPENSIVEQPAEIVQPTVEKVEKDALRWDNNEKSLNQLFAKIDSNSKALNSFLDAFETNKSNSDANFKSIETAFNGLKEYQNAAQKAVDAALIDLKNKIETVEQKAVEIQSAKQAQSEDPQDDPLRRIFTNQKIWLRLAIVVTLIFLPFTVMGLYKHIAIPTDAWYSAFGVGLLCTAIALVWDMAIFLFTINGKKGMAIFGSLVQVVFFSAKFNFVGQIVTDMGYKGEYWQNLIVVFCAVIYSPMLLANVADLSINSKNKEA